MSPTPDEFAEEPAETAAANRDYNPAAAAATEPDEHPDAQISVANGASLQSPAFLTSLVKWHPAIGGFQFLADCFHGRKGDGIEPAHQRFTQTYKDFKPLFWICVVIDVLLMVAVLSGLGAVATRIAYITLFQ